METLVDPFSVPFMQRAWLELALLATVLGLAIGIPIALISASRPNGARDAAAQTVGLAALAIPSFLLGSLLLAYVSRIFHYNPNALGFVRLQEDPALNLQQMLLEPETLSSIDPDPRLVGTLISLKNVIPQKTKETARQVVRKVVDDLERKLRNPLTEAVRGARWNP